MRQGYARGDRGQFKVSPQGHLKLSPTGDQKLFGIPSTCVPTWLRIRFVLIGATW